MEVKFLNFWIEFVAVCWWQTESLIPAQDGLAVLLLQSGDGKTAARSYTVYNIVYKGNSFRSARIVG